MERLVDAGPTRDMFNKQLAWEGLNVPTRNAVASLRNDDFPKWVVAIHYLDLGVDPIAALTACTDSFTMEHVQKTYSYPEGCPDCMCWGCGKPGHLN